jgi:hypothetical protein
VGTETLDENLTMVLCTGRELGPQGRSFPAVRATATDRDRANRDLDRDRTSRGSKVNILQIVQYVILT